MSKRDSTIARVACAVQMLTDAKEALQLTMNLYIQGDEDEHGDERKQLLNDAADAVSNAATSLNEAIQSHERLSFNELIAAEYDDEDEDDEEAEENDDEEDREFADAAG